MTFRNEIKVQNSVIYFPDNYFEGRERFREAATRLGGILETYQNPNIHGPGGEPLFVDVVILGNPDAEKVLFNIGGVHGLEAPAASAMQTYFLSSGLATNIAPEICVVLVHGINPHGWVYSKQTNENSFDLNRNFIDHADPPISDKIHEKITELIGFKNLSDEALGAAWMKIQNLSDQFSKERLLTAISNGQYTDPKGIKYGGNMPAWSNLLLRDIAARTVANANFIALIDWHTGLGEFGELIPVVPWGTSTEAFEITNRMWGLEHDVSDSSTIDSVSAKSAVNVDSVSGMAISAVRDAVKDGVVFGGVIEFGTVSFELIVQATVLDKWLDQHNSENKHISREWIDQLRDWFCPNDPSWRELVLERAHNLYASTLQELQEL